MGFLIRAAVTAVPGGTRQVYILFTSHDRLKASFGHTHKCPCQGSMLATK